MDRMEDKLDSLLAQYREACPDPVIVMGAFLIPRLQSPPAYQASYLDVLVAADSANDVAVIPVSETE